MWEKFTERTRRIIYRAQEEAHRYGHPNVGTEHLLLGILDEPDSMAARVLETLAGSLDSIRMSTVNSLPAGSKNPATKIGRTRSARRVLELAEDEATQQGADHIASGHLLVGLVRCREGGAAHILENCSVILPAVRAEITAELTGQNSAKHGEDARLDEHSTMKSLPPLVRSALGHTWRHLSYRSRRAIEAALSEAAQRGDTIVTPNHLVLGALKDSDSAVARVFRRMEVDVEALVDDIKALLKSHGEPRKVDRHMELRATTCSAISDAEMAARVDGTGVIGTAHLVMGVLTLKDTNTAAVLKKHQVNLATLRSLYIELHENDSKASADPDQLSKLTLSQMISRSLLKGKHLLRISDLTPADVALVFAVTDKLKSRKGRVGADEASALHRGKTLALVFQKPSLRTRVTFEIGMNQLGGQALHLGPDEIGVGERESPADVARNLERWVHGIVARTFKHSLIEELAANSTIPVINGLSDLEHPCQALADLYTLRERKGTVKGLTLMYIGDGNNVCRSLMELCALTGTNLRIASPEGYEPHATAVAALKPVFEAAGAELWVGRDPIEAAKGSDAVYTDVWASMGQEEEAAIRHVAFQPYQLNMKVVNAANPQAIVLHCQPAHRGEEITSEAMDCSTSAIFDQAENRMHVQKALMALML